MTTQYGPAWADVSLSSSDFLPCFGPYALCYYADCTVSADGTVSDCPCYEWFGPNFVAINAILNADSYQATVAQCTADPASCQVTNGAPVCADLNRGDFYANATRVSTFGFYRAPVEPIGVTDCSDGAGAVRGLHDRAVHRAADGEPMAPRPSTATARTRTGPSSSAKTGCRATTRRWRGRRRTIPTAAAESVRHRPRRLHPRRAAGPVRLPALHVDDDAAAGERRRLQQGLPGVRQLPEVRHHDPARLHLRRDALHLGRQPPRLRRLPRPAGVRPDGDLQGRDAADCSCCASQLCNCDANRATEQKIYELDAAQRALGETPQCDINGTLCGAP